MKNLPTFKYSCISCNNQFFEVALNCYSYGEFLFWSKSGECFYFNIFDDHVFDELKKITSIVIKNKGFENFDTSENLITTYLHVACDKDFLNEFYEFNQPPCPFCGSTTDFNVSEVINGYKKIENAQHKNWNFMTFEEKYLSINNFFKSHIILSK